MQEPIISQKPQPIRIIFLLTKFSLTRNDGPRESVKEGQAVSPAKNIHNTGDVLVVTALDNLSGRPLYVAAIHSHDGGDYLSVTREPRASR